MLTLQDCVGLSGMDPREIDAVAEHERLTYIVALEKGAWMLDHSWGPPAIRQMISDDIEDAAARGDTMHAQELRLTYRLCCHHLPRGVDRRQVHRHYSHLH